MSGESAHQRPGQIFGRRVHEARKRRGWTQQQLADRVEELGYPMSRFTIMEVEKGGKRSENAPLHEVLSLAAALGVAPVHLIVPREDEVGLALGKLHIPAIEARAWIRGTVLLPGGDPLSFFAELPVSEQRALLRDIDTEGLDAVNRALAVRGQGARIEQTRAMFEDQVVDRKLDTEDARKRKTTPKKEPLA